MERLRNLPKSLFDLVYLGYESTVLGEDNLNILNAEPKNPAIVYFNHATKDDIFITIALLHKYAPDRLKGALIPISGYHSEFSKNPAYSITSQYAKRFGGFSMPKITQSYRRNGEGKKTSDNNDLLKQDRNFAHVTKSALSAGRLVIISPEGHRSSQANLLPAEAGVSMIARFMKGLKDRRQIENGYFIPLGLVFDSYEGPHKLHINFKNKPKLTISVGNPIDVDTLIRESSKKTENKNPNSPSHYLMERLAQILPGKMRGVYSEGLLSETYMNRFELRLDESGRVYIFDKVINSRMDYV